MEFFNTLEYVFIYIVAGIIVFAIGHFGHDDKKIYQDFWLAVIWPLTIAVGFTIFISYTLYKIPGFLADAILWLLGQDSDKQKDSVANGNE